MSRYTDSLHVLITGLSKSEKRYFKRFALINGDSQSAYLKLFDEIDSQTTYDEGTIRQKFKGESFLNQLSVSKNYLFHSILKSLELYYQANDINTRIRSYLNRSELLYNRSLFREAGIVIEKAITLCRKYELFDLLLEAIRVKRLLAHKEFNWKKQIEISNEKREVIEILDRSTIYEQAKCKISDLFYSNKGEEKQSKYILGILAELPHNKEEEITPFVARRDYYLCRMLYHDTVGNEGSVHKYAKKTAELYYSNPAMIEYYASEYIMVLSNLFYASSKRKDMSSLKHTIGKLVEAEKFVKTQTQANYYFYIQYTVLHYHHIRGEFVDSIAYIKDSILDKMNTYEQKLGARERFLLYINISISYFGAERYKETLKWLNKINNELKIHYDQDTVAFEKLLKIITHFELKHFDTMPYLIRSMYRFLLKSKQLDDFYKIILAFFRRIAENPYPTHGEIIKSFAWLKQKLVHSQKSVLESESLEHFDLICWLESKIEGRSFAELVRKKAEK